MSEPETRESRVSRVESVFVGGDSHQNSQDQQVVEDLRSRDPVPEVSSFMPCGLIALRPYDYTP
jgi:hypothetical protein